MHSCFQLFPLVLFVVVRGHVKEAAASMRSCDSAGIVANFPSLKRKWEEGGNHFSAAERVQRAPFTTHFHSTGLNDLVLDHICVFSFLSFFFLL